MVPFFPKVTTRSATRFSSQALACVVLIRSCSISDCTRFFIIAQRCDRPRPSLVRRQMSPRFCCTSGDSASTGACSLGSALASPIAREARDRSAANIGPGRCDLRTREPRAFVFNLRSEYRNS